MEYTDYMGLPDDLFFLEVSNFYNDKSKEKFQFLKERPFIMDRYKRLVSDNFIQGDKKRSSLNFIKSYDSYVVLSNVLDVVSNPLKYYVEDRVRIFNAYNSFSGDMRGLSLFSKDDKLKVKHVIDGYDMVRKVSDKSNLSRQYEAKFDRIVASLKRVLDAYSKYGDCSKFYSLMYDNMNIKQSSFRSITKYTKMFFCDELCTGTDIEGKSLLNEFSFDDVCLLEKINSSYFRLFDNYNFKVDEFCTSISDYEKLFKLFDQISTSMNRRKGLEYTVDYVSTDLRISLDRMEKDYYFIFKSYCAYKLRGIDCDSELKKFLDSRKLKYSDFSNFTDIMDMYRELVCRSCHLLDLVCNEKKHIRTLSEMLYRIKFFNGVTPSTNQGCLMNRMRSLDEKSQAKAEKFISGYRNYFDSMKELLTDQKRQEITDNEVNNMDSYVTNVKLFLESGCKSVDEYFGNNIDDKEAFEFSLKILKSYSHPIYQEYFNYLESIENEKHNRLVDDCLELVGLINNGIVLPDGEKRNFDLVDFYLCSNLNRQRFMNVIRDRISSDQYANVSRFFSQYRGERTIEKNDLDILYGTSVKFPVKWDDNGNVISYYEATKEDKVNAILTIGTLGIPLTSVTYGIVLKDTINKSIDRKDLTNYKKRV